ncbi:putative type IX secretion system sortase PorU2 [Hymenobacter persicinus]|uniref:Gingipain domain-containing protein n=1 Tax=Hymenobacter persicinus TaxID=2025506 RepID=A0A4Q5L7X1_9BACT|nr:C25 family cysteine peptidase [Hymenobacter persicinus]RYU77710.1 hypothetical protein EWM57_17120 [Hymenobacter persicinus]
MKQRYTSSYLWSWGLLVLGLLLGSGLTARAQSGPYGNEWIVPGQQYYKIRLAQNGIYRLDYAYLTQAGISGVNPQRFQLWRRGKETAIYVGGNNPTVLDNSTYIEFYGQRNDGALDRGMYKNPADQAQRNYSLYTDTAAYFLTWSATAQGRRMAQPNVNPVGGNHPYWIQPRLAVQADRYSNVNEMTGVYQQWMEAGEGFLSRHYGKGQDNFRDIISAGTLPIDSVWSKTTNGPQPQLEMLLTGASGLPNTIVAHTGNIYVLEPGTGNKRLIRSFVIPNFDQLKIVTPLQRSELGPDGKVQVRIEMNTGANPTVPLDWVSFSYLKVTFTQTARWFAGRRSFSFSNDSTLGSAPAYYTLDSIPTTVRGFDITDPYNLQRIEGLAGTGTKRSYVFPSATPGSPARKLLLADVARPLSPLSIQRVQFRTISPAAYNFLIVSHQALMKPAGGSQNPVREYAAYRASTAGGRYDTLVTTVGQLYDQFHYGEKSALAIRQFAQYMLTNTRPKSLLLLGKGLITGEYGLGGYFRKNEAIYSPTVRDLVPTSTRGGGDIFFTADWQNSNYAGRMATGRISAQTSLEVLNYLNKLKEHEEVISRPDGPDMAWRKNALHLLGNQTANEVTEFGYYLNKYKRRIESPLFAGTVVKTYSKTDPGLPASINISNELNAGLSIINYFGHGSQSDLELDIGNIRQDPSRGNNKGKYPVMFVNGCAAGNSFSLNNARYPEDWLLVADKGLIGFMAESSFGFTTEIDALQDKTFELLLNDPQWYGKPVAEIQNEVGRRLQNTALNTELGHSTIMCTVWHADPALRLFSPPLPDFTYGAPALELKPIGAGPILSTTPQFQLLVKVRNPGKVTYDKLDISVKRSFDGTTRADEIYTFNGLRQALRDTTYVLTLDNTGSPFGTNTFTTTLDYQNRVAELNEQNNTATTSFVFVRPGITLLNPPEFAIVNSNNLRLVGQTNVVRASRPFEVELDTVPTFNSSLIRRTIVTAPVVAEWRPKVPVIASRDSVVWYWRMRFQTKLDPSENTEWSVSSFRVINSGPGGWSQSHHGQFQRDELQRLNVAAPSGKWSFDDQTLAVRLRTQGATKGAVTFDATYGVQLGADQLSVLSCGIGVPNILVSVIDGSTLKSMRNIAGGPYDSCGVAPNRFYHFATSATDSLNSATRQQQLLSLLTNVPTGAYVALVTVNRVNFSAMSPAVKAALAALGAQKVSQLQNGDAYVLLARRGAAGQTQEATYDPGQPGARTEQVASLTSTLRSNSASGVLTSTLIGPAQKWETLYHTVRTEPSDSYVLQLVGVDAQRKEQVIQANVTNRTLPLTSVSATQYPYLKLRLVLRDTLNRTAPQLKQLMVTYQGLPEGVVRADSVLAKTPLAYDPATLTAQAATGYLKVPVVFQNVSPLAFGTPLKARITVRSTGGTTNAEKVTEVIVPNLDANKALQFDATADVRDLNGDLTLQVDLNMNKDGARLPELFYFNNVLTLPSFRVESSNLPPVLDVAFDGQHILNGDIVKPQPSITILMTASNRLRPIKQDNAFDVVLIRPDGTQTRVDLLRDNNIVFTADSAKGTARLEYQPGKNGALPDGVYKLEVQGRDANNTQATVGTKYSIMFEVINASTITHLYPYPNPITSKARFVFTLTGAELPRNMKIQIMTLTGKVVKEIMMPELGSVRIGNNITDYAWDGTDEFGDRLANGTYLYRVVMDDPNKQFDRRKTAGDKSFKNEWGKLVLLR